MEQDDILTAKLLNASLLGTRRQIDEAEYRVRVLRGELKVNRRRRDRIIVAEIKAGMSVREAARQTGMPVPTVASIYQAGK